MIGKMMTSKILTWDLQRAQSHSVHCAHKCEMGLGVSKQWQQWSDQKKWGPGKVLWKCHQQWDYLGWGVVAAGLPRCKQFKSISCPTYLLSKLRKVQNNTATLILWNPRSAQHVSFLLWPLPDQRIQNKIFCFDFKISDQAPSYLWHLLHLCSLSQQHHSSADTQVFRIPSFHVKFSGHYTF